jgi:hypothetical protein
LSFASAQHSSFAFIIHGPLVLLSFFSALRIRCKKRASSIISLLLLLSPPAVECVELTTGKSLGPAPFRLTTSPLNAREPHPAPHMLVSWLMRARKPVTRRRRRWAHENEDKTICSSVGWLVGERAYCLKGGGWEECQCGGRR